MVEQGTHKPLVVGSNPSLATYRHSLCNKKLYSTVRAAQFGPPSQPFWLWRGLCFTIPTPTPTQRLPEQRMKYDLDRYIDRRTTDSVKWRYHDEDVLALWVADMDFLSAQPILDALHDRVDHGIFGYTYDKLIPGLHQTIQERLERLYNWRVEAGEIMFLSGVVVGFNLACHAIGDPGDDVLMQPPVYYPFLSAPGNAGKQAQYAQVHRAGNSFEIDMAAFEQAITERTRLFILCKKVKPSTVLMNGITVIPLDCLQKRLAGWKPK